MMDKKDEEIIEQENKTVPDKETRKQEMLRNVIACVNENPKLRQMWQNKKEKSELREDFPYPEHLQVEYLAMEKFRMEFLTWKDSESRLVILQLHGGGYIGTIQDQYRKMAGLYSEVSGGAAVLTINYRVAPEYPFPAALEDAETAYNWLLERGYSEENILVAGDSAGGGLAMALCHLLKRKGKKLPCGLVAMSPWTDLSISGASYVERAELDPVFGNDASEEMLYNNPYIGDDDPRNPLISPLYGDFSGFPPMLVQVGTHEMLYDDSRSVVEKARRSGVSVRFHEYEGMFHVFQMAGTMIKESKRAWEEVGTFVHVIQGK